MAIELAAHLFTALVGVVIIFQIALAAGVPWGHLTWGGKFSGRLPKQMRGVAVFSAVLLAAFAVIVETQAGVILHQWQGLSQILIWVVVAYCALGTLMSAITPSKWERIIWLPVVLVSLVCSLIVALG
jgi:cytochrome bd-type quinol oxidase subunit 1